MGQQFSNECYCQETFLQLCAPEDPKKEEQNTLPGYETHPVPGYPSSTMSEGQVDPSSQNFAMNVMMRQGGGFDLTSEERAFVSAPPPQDGQNAVYIPPPSPSGGTPPPRSPKPQAGGSPSRRDVTPDDILSNLEGSEEVLYGDAFAMFPGGGTGYVGLDSGAMRDFICTNSAISMQDVDLELLKVASPEEGLTQFAFLQLLRENPISEGDAISHFLGMSSDGENLVADECRSGLLLFAQQKLSGNFNEERWECILNTVMWDAGVMVPMEQWLSYCKLTGRMVRLLRYAQVQKFALAGQSGKSGVRGGA